MFSDGTACCSGNCVCPAIRAVWYTDPSGIIGAAAVEAVAKIPMDIVPFRCPTGVFAFPFRFIEAGLCNGNADGNLIPPLARYDQNGNYSIALQALQGASVFFISGNSITASLGKTVNGKFQTTPIVSTTNGVGGDSWGGYDGLYLTGTPQSFVTSSVLIFGPPGNWRNCYIYFDVAGSTPGGAFGKQTGYYAFPFSGGPGTFMTLTTSRSGLNAQSDGFGNPITVGVHTQIQLCGGFLGVILQTGPVGAAKLQILSAKSYPSPQVVDLPAIDQGNYLIFLEPNEFSAYRTTIGL